MESKNESQSFRVCGQVHIDRLPIHFMDEELRLLLQTYGTVLVARMTVSPKDSGQGWGYIQMLTSRAATAAKVHLNRTLVRGHEILVFFEEHDPTG